MRLAVISDIHGNLEAFGEVLADIDGSRIDEIVCLGDNIGYGPDPEAVMELLGRHDIPSILGNHEMGILDPRTLDWFNPTARTTLIRTQSMISADSLAGLTGLPASLVRNGCLFVHGCPPSDVFTYLIDLPVPLLEEIFHHTEEGICWVGHTHWLQRVSYEQGQVVRRPLPVGRTPLPLEHKHIINVGSVGQPRDGNADAKYVIWDDAHRTVEVRAVPYDIGKTAEKIINLGFPRIYADRLWWAG